MSAPAAATCRVHTHNGEDSQWASERPVAYKGDNKGLEEQREEHSANDVADVDRKGKQGAQQPIAYAGEWNAIPTAPLLRLHLKSPPPVVPSFIPFPLVYPLVFWHYQALHALCGKQLLHIADLELVHF